MRTAAQTEEDDGRDAGAADEAGREDDARQHLRRRGRRPADAAERRRRVEQAVAELTSARVPFTMGDVAERAGISRATLYRDAGLRDLVGSQGEGPAARPVDYREYQRLRERAAALSAERRSLRRELKSLETRLRDESERRRKVEDALRAAREQQRAHPDDGFSSAAASGNDAYKEGFAAGFRAATQRPGATGAGRGGPGGGGAAVAGELRSVAARLPKASLAAARRTLARQLHPDLFAKDPAAAMLATELLKQINALVGPGG